MRQAFRVRWAPHLRAWTWECTLCWPPARGARFGPDAWNKIIGVSLPHHMRCRGQHHEWVIRNRKGVA